MSVNWGGRSGPDLQLDASLWGRLAPCAGLLLGGVRQLVDRRDLADRLLFPALSFVLVAVLHLLASGAFTTLSGLFMGLGVLVGLILTEQWLRRSDAVVVDQRSALSGAETNGEA